MEEGIARLDTETAAYCEYLLHGYPEGKINTFCIKVMQFQFSVLTHNMAAC